MLWILANRLDAQGRLRGEIRATQLAYAEKHNISSDRWEDVRLPYDTLMGMPYLDAVVREMLRVYPPSSLLHRVYV